MSKRRVKRERHLSVVHSASAPSPVNRAGRAGCKACLGTGLVRDQYGVECICVPCYLPRPLASVKL